MDAPEVTSVSRVPDVKLVPHVDADIAVVISAADHVAELLPKPPRTYSIGERLDGITMERLKALGRAII